MPPGVRARYPDGWRERWRLIREFTERWHRVPMPDIGGRQAEIAETEKRLGRVLPPSVREWVAFAQDVRHLQAFSSDLDNQLTLQPLVDELALSLLYVPYDEGHRAVRFAEFDAADPPVEYYRQEFNGADLPATCVSIPDPYFPIQPVTGWVFDHLIPRLPARGGRFHYDVTDPASFYPEFDRRLSPRVRVGNSIVIETANILIWFGEAVDHTRHSLILHFARRLTRDEMPETLAGIVASLEPQVPI